jgi:Transposase DDE domain
LRFAGCFRKPGLGIIVDAEGTRANRSEETAVKTMIARVAGRYDLSPKRLAADTAYGTGRLLRWLTDRDIAPHIPVWTSRGRRTAASRATTSPMTKSATSTSALAASY